MDWAIYLPFVYFIFWGILLQNAHFALENCIYIYERPTRFWYQPCVTLLRLAGKFFSGQPCVAWSLYCCCFCRPDLPVLVEVYSNFLLDKGAARSYSRYWKIWANGLNTNFFYYLYFLIKQLVVHQDLLRLRFQWLVWEHYQFQNTMNAPIRYQY